MPPVFMEAKLDTQTNFVNIIEDMIDRKIRNADMLSLDIGRISRIVGKKYAVVIGGVEYELNSVCGTVFPGDLVIVAGNTKEKYIIGNYTATEVIQNMIDAAIGAAIGGSY